MSNKTLETKCMVIEHLQECVEACDFAISLLEEKCGGLYVSHRVNLRDILPDEAYKGILSQVRKEIVNVRSAYRHDAERLKKEPYKVID